MNTNKSQQISINFNKFLQISIIIIILFIGTFLFFFSQKNFSIISQPTTKAQSSYPQCQQGRITSPCQCGNKVYNAGFCCYHPNANSGIWFDPSYEDIFSNGCPTGNFYFVDQNNPNASDENLGTEELPWKTLKKACNTVVAGDAVIVKAGRYSDPDSTWASAFTPVNSGEPGKPIIFKSYPKHAAILEKGGSGDCGMRVNGRNYIIIDGFKVIGGIGFHDCGYCEIRNCDVIEGRNSDTSLNWGIFLHTSHHCIIENNYVHDMEEGPYPGHHNAACIMLFASSDSIIENNIADAKVLNGQKIYSAFGQKGGQIYRNIWRYNIALNATTGFFGKAATACDNASEDNIYYQNIAINCSKAAFELNHMCYRFQIYNNVAYNCGAFISAWLESNQNNSVWNNIAIGTDTVYYLSEVTPETFFSYSDYNNLQGSLFCSHQWRDYAQTLAEWQQKTPFDDHSTSTDPLFVNAEVHDFHLNPNSPCLNAGIDRQDYDNDGNTTESINMGAYITGNETIGLIGLSQYIVEESQPSSCASQNGVCCNENQICQNGTFISSSDCGNLCCTGECVSPSIFGDLNQDNKVNSSDFQILIQKFKETQNIEIEDLNSDGIVDIKDIGILMHYWTN